MRLLTLLAVLLGMASGIAAKGALTGVVVASGAMAAGETPFALPVVELPEGTYVMRLPSETVVATRAMGFVR